ncbi:MAG: glycosyltransferase family 117 protein [Bacteroidales bacterium]
MSNFKIVNRISGWIIFLIAAIVYLLTIEPTTSFWDCGEFIASAYKLQVGHPPGAPIFMIISRFFTFFAGGDVTKAAMMVNAMSGLASAFTILFLFWTITHLAKKMFPKTESLSMAQLIVVIGSGAVGALAYTFSDTFWFSAVEGEVYAMSSLFTAFVFWAILKWENIADEKYSNRWLVLIAYLMGLSIGVHLLNLLAIPAIVFVFYFKKYKVTRAGMFKAFIVSLIILGTIMYVIIPGLVKVASWFDLLFVNGFGLPFKSGVIFYIVLLISLIIWGLYYTSKKKKVILNTIILGVTVILIGYSSFAMIVIRSLANPPMDENNPETVFNLLHYINREQYGSRPLFKGQYYNAPIVDSETPYTYRQKDGKYVKSYSLNDVYEYDERFTTFFPRMYSPDPSHVEEYKKWADIKGKKVTITNYQGEQEIRNVPTFGENLKFFFRYQLGHMYWRYFMWNFSGRQNDTQGHGELLNGNWITGLNFIDNKLIGPQENIPDSMKNHKSRNTYYMLPLLLGLVGFFFHLKRHTKDFMVVFLLFIFTGIAIVVYLNQYPLQPRERDYAYAGSFYAFSIWIGLGVMGIYNFFKIKANAVFSAILATVLSLVFVPGIMAKENWDDHDRSNRYIARDFAYNYLNSCAPNAILFTHGDNDTFPLWYAQEVEGIRTDVRVVNLSLLNTDWYIDQMKHKAYESDPVPFGMTHEEYLNGVRDVIYINDRINDYVDVKRVIDFLKSDDKRTKLQVGANEWIDYLPTNKIIVPVDSAKVVANGTVKPDDADKIISEIKFEINKQRIVKSEMMILDLLANNNWERPVYFVSTSGDGNIGLEDYLQQDGFAYRLVPIKTPAKGYLETGRIDSDIMYTKLMDEFKWGNMNDPDIWMDYTTKRTVSVVKIRNLFTRLAHQLIKENKKDSALNVLRKGAELTPKYNIPYDLFTLDMIEAFYLAGGQEEADSLVRDFAEITNEELNYYFSLPSKFSQSLDYEQRLSIHSLQRMADYAKRYGDPELAVSIEQDLENSFNLFSTRQP